MCYLSDLQQSTSEPAATCLSIWHEDEQHRRELEYYVREIQKNFSGSREGQATVWTGISGECDTAQQVNVDKTYNVHTKKTELLQSYCR